MDVIILRDDLSTWYYFRRPYLIYCFVGPRASTLHHMQCSDHQSALELVTF